MHMQILFTILPIVASYIKKYLNDKANIYEFTTKYYTNISKFYILSYTANFIV